MKLSLGNFKCDEIKDDNFTLASYISQHKLSKVRLYLFSKSERDENERISSSDSEAELPPAFEIVDDGSQSSGILIGSSKERSSLREQQDVEFRESLFMDQQMEIEREQERERMQEEIDKEESLYKSRCERVPVEPNLHDPHAKVSVRHITLGVQTRRFPQSCQVSSLYDWVGSLSRYPAHFSLSSCGVSDLDPTLPITSVDRALVSMAESDEELTFPIVNGNQPLQEYPKEITIPTITGDIPDVLLEDDESLVPSEVIVDLLGYIIHIVISEEKSVVVDG